MTGSNEANEKDSQSAASSAASVVDFYRRLSEPARIAVGVVGILLGVSVPILLVVYRGAIWRAIVWLFTIVVVAASVGGVVLLFRKGQRWRRQRMQARERAALEPLLAQQRERQARLMEIEEGKLKPLPISGGLLLHNSEILWFCCRASVSDNGSEVYTANLYITSMRLAFTCSERPVELRLKDINAVDFHPEGLEIISKTKTQVFAVGDPEIVAAYIRRTVRAHHRQQGPGSESKRSRHIPANVKTAVWQRDGGKCVECGGQDCLEFDHIIPHSKGGANSVENVQLLCRRCNSRKGAAI